MGFVVRLHDQSSQRELMVGRVPSARDAFHLMRAWREEHPEAWVEITAPAASPSFRPYGDAA